MAQVQLDVLYDVKGLGALKQSQAVLNGSSNAAKGAAASATKLGNAVGGVGGKAAASAVGVKAFGTASKYASAGVKALGASIASTLGPIAAATAIIGAFGAGLKTISDVDFSAAKLRSLGVDAGKLGNELRGVTQELEGQASQAELMGAAYDVASAGFTDAADAASVLTAASKGATGGFSDLNTVANATTSVLNAYGKSASEAERLVDSFIQTQNDGKIVIGEYAANISKVAPVAAALGIELGEVNAIISQVTATGTKAEVAFTGLKTALARLASGEANKALEEIGYSVNAAELEAKGLVGVLEEMKAQGITVGQAFQAFGTEAGPVIQAVFNDLDKVNRLLENQKNSVGAAAAAQAQAANTIQGAWKSVQTALSNLFADQSAFGVLIKGTLQALAAIITDVGNRLNILLAPLKLMISTVGMIAAKVQQLGVAFQQGLQQSEGWQKISALFAAIGGYFQQAADVLKQKFGAAFQAALEWAKEFGKYVGETLFKAIEKLVLGLAAVMKVIPGLQGLGAALENAWYGFLEAIGEAPALLNKTGQEAENLEEKIKALQLAANVLGQQLQGALAAETASIDNALRVTQARYAAENQILDARKQSATAALGAAKTDADREKAAREIYEATVAQAELQYRSTVAAAQAEEAKLAAQARYIAGQVQIQQMKLAEAQAAGTVTQAHHEAVNQANQALQIAQQNIQAQQQITDAIVSGAKATLNAKTQAATLAREMMTTNSMIRESAQGANQLANNLQRAASAASAVGSAAASAGGGGSRMVSGGSSSHVTIGKYKAVDGQLVEKTAKEIQQEYLSSALSGSGGKKIVYDNSRMSASFGAQLHYANASGLALWDTPQGGVIDPRRIASSSHRPDFMSHYSAQLAMGNPFAYAEGGYVTGPQQAIVGEGGEPEYIIPASKMDSAMARYSSGSRGDSVIPKSATVNVNYSGSTVSMGGSDYISKDDVPGLLNSAVNQTLGTLRRSSRSRLYAGFDR